jgi:hypothetical protein
MDGIIIGALLAQRAVENVARSAQPGAPAHTDAQPRTQNPRLRIALAAALHHLADRLTPVTCPAPE